MRITIFKPYRRNEVINRVELDEVVRRILAGEEMAVVKGLREAYHLMYTRRLDDGRVECNIEGGIGLPRVCFAAEYENRKGEQRLLAYNGLVVLEVNNLAGYDEAIAIREAAKRLPQTMLEMIAATFRKPTATEKGRWWTVTEISELLKSRYSSADVRNVTLTQLGQTLNFPRFSFESKRRAPGAGHALSAC